MGSKENGDRDLLPVVETEGTVRENVGGQSVSPRQDSEGVGRDCIRWGREMGSGAGKGLGTVGERN